MAKINSPTWGRAMPNEKPQEKSKALWIGLTIGLLIGSVFGTVIYVMFLRLMSAD